MNQGHPLIIKGRVDLFKVLEIPLSTHVELKFLKEWIKESKSNLVALISPVYPIRIFSVEFVFPIDESFAARNQESP